MENENLSIELSVGEWNSILAVLSAAPFAAVNQISSAVNKLQLQAAPVIEELSKKYAPAEGAAEAAE
jgi:hypothetical protein